MPRVPLNETKDLPEEHRWLFERMEQRGDILNRQKVMQLAVVVWGGRQRCWRRRGGVGVWVWQRHK